MQLKFDGGELEGSKYLGAGEHNCRITKIEKKPTKKGGEMVEIEFTAASGRTSNPYHVSPLARCFLSTKPALANLRAHWCMTTRSAPNP